MRRSRAERCVGLSGHVLALAGLSIWLELRRICPNGPWPVRLASAQNAAATVRGRGRCLKYAVAMKGSGQKRCFVIAPIGDKDSPVRKRSDQILRHVIAPVVDELGYDAIRADQMPQPGVITNQVIERIAEDELVIADLTGSNPNVFYELALRHAMAKPLIQIIERGEKIPFDVIGMRTIEVDHKDLDSVEDAKEEIRRQIDALETQSEPVETPVSFMVQLRALRESEDPRGRSLADLMEGMAEMKADLRRIAEFAADTADRVRVDSTLDRRARAAAEERLAQREAELKRLLSQLQGQEIEQRVWREVGKMARELRDGAQRLTSANDSPEAVGLLRAAQNLVRFLAE
jgi:hypothetical protein